MTSPTDRPVPRAPDSGNGTGNSNGNGRASAAGVAAARAAGLMVGRKGLIMGVANERSIAWGIAKACHAAGAELAFTYQGDVFGQRVKPLVESIGAKVVVPADVEDAASLDALFDTLAGTWGSLDFVVHAIAYSDKDELKGRYVDTTRANFQRSLTISCYSFTDIAHRAEPLMQNGGSLLTLTYSGARHVMPSYNVMGVAKAALEASVRYLAADLGPRNIRVNAISAGPMRTLAAAVIGDGRYVYRVTRETSPLRRNIDQADVGGAALYLLSDLSAGVTGELHHVDSGYHIMGMAPPATGNGERE